ncbi:MAG TPA: Fic family protein [Candidatus Saccharimonadia bacterium]|nr:Fic family protein [Candidatus Saccharimonadia bacterium]
MNYRTQLTSILKASGWSQEQLARALGVSFPTLNSWINGRSEPRTRAVARVQALYLEIVGADNLDLSKLDQTKTEAAKLKLTAKDLLKNTPQLDKLTLHLTYHTNTIEGSTMTLVDVEEVIFEHKVLTNRTAIEQTEARNHQAALYWLIEQLVEQQDGFHITEALILGLHLRLMNGIIGDAGRYRSHAVRIMGANVPLANHMKVPSLVAQLADDAQKPQTDMVQALAATHASFEKIHPFSDGNGRTGRLIMLAQALHAGLVPPLVAKERKQAYYKYLEAAQLREIPGPLELFVAESMRYTDTLLKEI